MIRRGLWALAIPFASIAMAEGITLQVPVDCTLGETCYIQQYMDHDPSDGARDFHCRGLSYDGHNGTDFAIPTQSHMRAGVNVLAAADGKVRNIRNGMPDTGFTKETAARVKGKECGNGIAVVHSGGWETQYCHLKLDSISVKPGQQVKAGDVLGQIGESGRAEFPHLHFSVRQDGKLIDPFDPDGTVTCEKPGDSTLWAETPEYQPGGMIDIGIAPAIPTFADVKAGTASADKLTPKAETLVVFGLAFGARKGDVLRLSLTGPDGDVITSDQVFSRDQALAFRAAGKKRRWWNRWTKGTYTGTATLIRDGAVINMVQTTTQLPLE